MHYNYLWIGTFGSGLCRLDKLTGKIQRFTVGQELPHNVIYAIQPDHNGHLWMSTNRGLCRFDIRTNEVRNYMADDGLPSEEFRRYHDVALPDGRGLGEAALDPSVLYVRLVRDLLAADLPVTYLSHITGHGLRKVMRAERDLGYVLTELPPVPPVLSAVASAAGLSPAEAYGTFNMGAGMAVMCRPGAGEAVVATATAAGHQALLAGRVEDGPRRVVLAPLDVVYGDDSLRLR